jgi:hypothetical protein
MILRGQLCNIILNVCASDELKQSVLELYIRPYMYSSVNMHISFTVNPVGNELLHVMLHSIFDLFLHKSVGCHRS